MHTDSQVPSLCCGRAQGAVICTTTAVEEEFWSVTPAIGLSVFWAWVNCRVLKWINLVTLKPFFYKTRKWIRLSHPNQQESCSHCRTVSLLKMRKVAIASQRQDTQTHLAGEAFSTCQLTSGNPELPPNFLLMPKQHQCMFRYWILTDIQGNSVWRIYRHNCWSCFI